MGFFKKLFKPLKKLGKFIKKQFKRVGKWFGKLGIFGQIALSFIPGIGPMISTMFKGLGQGAMRILAKGLAHSSPLVSGAAKIIDTARAIVGGIQKGFKTVTSAATSFVKNTTKYLGNKMKFQITANAGPTKFFGTGADSVFGQVGREVTNNFAEFKEVIGGIFENPGTRSKSIFDKLATTKVGGVKVNVENLDKQLASQASDPETFKNFQLEQMNKIIDIQEGMFENYGPRAGYQFQTFSQNMLDTVKKKGSLNPFGDTLKFITEEADYVTKLARGTTEQFADWNKWNEGIKDAVDPFKSELKTTIGSSLETTPSLLKKTGNYVKDSIAAVPGNLLTTAVTQRVGLSGQPMEYAEQTRNALDIYTPRTPFNQLPESPYSMSTGYDPMSSAQEYNYFVTSLMNQDGNQSQAYYGGLQPFQPLQTIGLPQVAPSQYA